jgi:hypothetical protein
MNGVLESVSTVLFFACGPVLLVVRFLRPKRMPWLLLVALTGLLSGMFELLAVHFAAAHTPDRESRSDAFVGGCLRGMYQLGAALMLYGAALLLRRASRS